jgi:K+-transporting ATPase KdpF subunit
LRAYLMFDLILGGGVAVCLLVYLVWALIRPEAL